MLFGAGSGQTGQVCTNKVVKEREYVIGVGGRYLQCWANAAGDCTACELGDGRWPDKALVDVLRVPVGSKISVGRCVGVSGASFKQTLRAVLGERQRSQQMIAPALA